MKKFKVNVTVDWTPARISAWGRLWLIAVTKVKGHLDGQMDTG